MPGSSFAVMMVMMVGTIVWAVYYDTLQPNPALRRIRRRKRIEVPDATAPGGKHGRSTVPAVAGLPVDQHLGNLEGKELRFGTSAGATFAALTVDVTDGAVNCEHDSLNPLAALAPDGRHVAQLHLRRQGRRHDQHAAVPDRRRLRRRPDGGTDARIPGQEDRRAAR